MLRTAVKQKKKRERDGVNMPDRSLTYSYLLDKYGLTLTWKQAAGELGVYWENVRRLCQRGEIQAQKVGRAWLLTTRALADYIDFGPAGERPRRQGHGRGKVLSL